MRASIVLLVCLGICCPLHVHASKQDEQKQSSAQTPRNESGDLVIVVQENSDTSEPAHERPAKSDTPEWKTAKETERLADYTYFLGWFTFGLATIAVAQLFMFYLQWKAMRETLASADRTATYQHRAYVGHWLSDRPKLTGNRYQVMGEIRNGGATPGYSVNVRAKVEVVQDAKTHVFGTIEDAPESRTFTIFPHGEPHQHGMEESFPDEIVELVKTCNAQIHARGVITYVTLGEPHRTYFHLHFVVGLLDGVPHGGWRYFEDGNNSAD